MNRISHGHLEFKARSLAAGAFCLLAFVAISTGTLRGFGQSSAPPAEQGSETQKKSQNPATPGPNSKKAAPQGAEKLGQSLKLSESPAFREAPLTGGEGGGYSSSMSGAGPAPSSTTVEEKAMEGLLLDSPRWRVGPRGLIEYAGPGGRWTAAPSGVAADLYAVSFSNRWVGWVVGRAGTILRTEDGGQTWRKISFPNREDLMAVGAEDWKSAQVTTRAGINYVTSNGGATWSAIRKR